MEEIKLVFNGADKPQTVDIKKGDWKIVAKDGHISAAADLGATEGGKITVAPGQRLFSRGSEPELFPLRL